MSAKFTPGPWLLSINRSACDGVNIAFGIDSALRVSIASGQSQEHLGSTGICEDECRANARLIAEAPSMLAALREAEAGLEFAGADQMVATGDFVPAPLLALRVVRAAIAAATGEAA